MSDRFSAGDMLIFQIESGFGLLKVLGTDTVEGETVWHVKAYRDLFMDIESADAAAAAPEYLSVDISHVPMTDRAFESTQVSRVAHHQPTGEEQRSVRAWRNHTERASSDRSIRLLLGLR